MIRSSNSLVVIALILQVYPSHSCIFSNYCRPYYGGDPIYYNFSTSLYDCLKTCYFTKGCNCVQYEQGVCLAFTCFDTLRQDNENNGCIYYKLDRASTAVSEQCKPVSDLL